MKRSLLRAALPVFAAAGIRLAVPPAHATVYLLGQTQFSGGGTATGTFTGEDADHDGFIVFSESLQEVTAFSLSFAGDANLPPFVLGLADLHGLVYKTGGDMLGDDPEEGLLANSAQVTYLAGLGALSAQGAMAFDPVSEAQALTAEPMTVSAVPEPVSLALWLGSVPALAWALRRRARRT